MRKTLFGILFLTLGIIFIMIIPKVSAKNYIQTDSEVSLLKGTGDEIDDRVFNNSQEFNKTISVEVESGESDEFGLLNVSASNGACQSYDKKVGESNLNLNVKVTEAGQMIFYTPVTTIYAGGGFYFATYFSSSIYWNYYAEPTCDPMIDYSVSYACSPEFYNEGAIERREGCYLVRDFYGETEAESWNASKSECTWDNYVDIYKKKYPAEENIYDILYYEDVMYIEKDGCYNRDYSKREDVFANDPNAEAEGLHGYKEVCTKIERTNTTCEKIKDTYVEKNILNWANVNASFDGKLEIDSDFNDSILQVDGNGWTECTNNYDKAVNNDGTWKSNSPLVTSCYYKIAKALIERKSAEVVYETSKINEDIYVEGGERYYTDLNLKSADYTLRVAASDLSRTGGSWNVTFQKEIAVKQNFYKEDEKGNFIGFNFLYRPIDITNPFPTDREIGDNWDNWYNKSDANKTRIANSYSKSEAKFTFNSLSEFKSSFGGMSDYLSFENISYDGTSNKVGKTTHSKLGELVKEGDDS